VQKLKATEQPTLTKQPILGAVGILVCPLADPLFPSAALCGAASPPLVFEDFLAPHFCLHRILPFRQIFLQRLVASRAQLDQRMRSAQITARRYCNISVADRRLV
jgi:hypothetical protein